MSVGISLDTFGHTHMIRLSQSIHIVCSHLHVVFGLPRTVPSPCAITPPSSQVPPFGRMSFKFQGVVVCFCFAGMKLVEPYVKWSET